MTWAILGFAALTTGTIATLAIMLSRSKDTTIAAIDMRDKERERANHAEADLALESAAHAETRRLLAAEKDLRSQAEAQRNEAWRHAREDAARIIEQSGIADAAHLGNRILSAPLPGVRLSDTPGNEILEP